MAPTNFVQSYNEKNTFPKSLVRHNSYEHTLDTYVDRLENQKARLFLQDESLTSLKSWTFNEQTRGRLKSGYPELWKQLTTLDFLPVSIENRAHLENHVAGPVIGLNAFQKHDPKAQFLYVLPRPQICLLMLYSVSLKHKMHDRSSRSQKRCS